MDRKGVDGNVKCGCASIVVSRQVSITMLQDDIIQTFNID